MPELKHTHLEACGWHVRTARNADGSGGWLVATCESVSEVGQAARFAQLFAASPDLLAVLIELVDVEGPLPGNQAWHTKALAAIAKATRQDAEARFANVACSQCGQGFGPCNHGFSHCADHAGA